MFSPDADGSGSSRFQSCIREVGGSVIWAPARGRGEAQFPPAVASDVTRSKFGRLTQKRGGRATSPRGNPSIA